MKWAVIFPFLLVIWKGVEFERRAETTINSGKQEPILDTLTINSDLYLIREYGVYGNDTILKLAYYCSYLDSLLVPNGAFFNYTINGNLSILSNYCFGKKHGNEYWFYTDTGKISNHLEYKDDTLTGSTISYYKNGNIQELGKCFHMLSWRYGKWHLYHENGKLSAIGNYGLINMNDNQLHETPDKLNFSLIHDYLSIEVGEWVYFDELGQVIKRQFHEVPKITTPLNFRTID